MGLANLIQTMGEINKAQDFFAMHEAAELLLIKFIPVRGKEQVYKIIENVVGSFPRIKESIPTFDFAIWNQCTVIEAIDLMIASGVVDGPSIDMNEESHILLEAYVGRTEDMKDYIRELEEELECYAPAPSGREKS